MNDFEIRAIFLQLEENLGLVFFDIILLDSPSLII